jgi:hypothetical protein
VRFIRRRRNADWFVFKDRARALDWHEALP